MIMELYLIIRAGRPGRTGREDVMFLPESIRDLMPGEDYETDDIGMSGASVLVFKDKILKVQDWNPESENEYGMLRYLQDRLPVPHIYAHEVSGGRSYLLMGKCEGQMACAPEYMENQTVLCRLLAEGLKRLWSVDISDCPSDQSLSHKLAQAARNIENGLVDMDNVEPDTFGENGFRDPAALLQWTPEDSCKL